MQQNKVTIYSSGMADFIRGHAVKGGGAETVIAIPVNKEHVGDFLDSLKVFGRVRLVKPPSYMPDDSETATLALNSGSALVSLLQQLVGVELTILHGATVYTGRNMGLDTQTTTSPNGETAEKRTLAMWVTQANPAPAGWEEGVQRFDLDAITRHTFPSKVVTGEIRKAMDACARKVNKETTLVEFTLASVDDQDQDAVVQYMTPLAAPKYTYRLSTGKEHAARLEMWGVVDNTTPADWDDMLSLVSGQPISFTTDVADIRRPERTRFNIVEDAALGAVEPAEYLGVAAVRTRASRGGKGPQGAQAAPMAAGRPRMAMMAARGGGALESAYSNITPASMSLAADAEMAYAQDGSSPMAQALRDEAEAAEVGDFQIWTTKTPQVIPAQQSSTIPLMSEDLPASESVLLYKPDQHATRAYRAVKFRNTTGKSLARGVVSVYAEGINVGKGIISYTKPDENAVVPHQLETGVRINREMKPLDQRLTHLTISEGMSVTEGVEWVTTLYTIKNLRGEKFRTYLEQSRLLEPGSDLVIVAHTGVPDEGNGRGFRVEQTSGGWRVAVTLEPNAEVTIETREQRAISSRITLNQNNYMGVIQATGVLRDNPTVQEAMAKQEEIGRQQKRLAEVRADRDTHEQEAKRATEYLRTVSSADAKTRWEGDIAKAEDAMRLADRTTIPNLMAEIAKLTGELQEILKRVLADLDLAKEAVAAR